MIPLHCLWAKSNNRTRDQFEYDLTWFCFELVCPHAQCGCWSIVLGGERGRERDSLGGERGIRLKLDLQDHGGGQTLDVEGQGG